MLKLLYIYMWRFFRFSPSFCFIFWNLHCNCPGDLLWKKKIYSNIETVFLSEWHRLWHSREHCPVFWSCLQFVPFCHCWKFLWSIIMEYSLFKIFDREGEISATLHFLWEALGSMSSKVDVMKVFQSIMTWYMNLLTLSFPLQYAKTT